MSKLKYTVIVEPNSTHHKIVEYLLLDKLRLSETHRAVIGGDRQDLKLVLTFEGNNHYLHLYIDDIYIQVAVYDSKPSGPYIFYSIKVLNGYQSNDVKEFKKVHDDADELPFEVKRFR